MWAIRHWNRVLEGMGADLVPESLAHVTGWRPRFVLAQAWDDQQRYIDAKWMTDSRRTLILFLAWRWLAFFPLRFGFLLIGLGLVEVKGEGGPFPTSVLDFWRCRRSAPPRRPLTASRRRGFLRAAWDDRRGPSGCRLFG